MVQSLQEQELTTAKRKENLTLMMWNGGQEGQILVLDHP